MTRNYPHPNCLLKCLPNCLSPTREGCLFQNNPRGEGNCETIERQNGLAAIFDPRHQDVSSGLLGFCSHKVAQNQRPAQCKKLVASAFCQVCHNVVFSRVPKASGHAKGHVKGHAKGRVEGRSSANMDTWPQLNVANRSSFPKHLHCAQTYSELPRL